MAWTERYVDAAAAGGGDGTTTATSGANGAWTLTEAIANAAAGQRINVKAGTYARTTTNTIFLANGTTTSSIWWRGYKTTAGDLDSPPTSSRTPGTDTPLISHTTGYFHTNCTYNLFSNISVSNSGASATRAGFIGVNYNSFYRCRFDCTSANASGYWEVSGTARAQITGCSFSSTSSATYVLAVTGPAAVSIIHCFLTGGGIGLGCTSVSASIMVQNTVFRSIGSHGISTPTAPFSLLVNACTFRGTGGDGVRLAAIPTTTTIVKSLFASIGGYGINNPTGTNTANAIRVANSFWSCTSGEENGFGDHPSYAGQTESSDPHVSSTDMTPASGSLSYGAAVLGIFPGGESYTSYADIGAVQHQDAGGGGPVAQSRIIQNIGTY